jgi:HlyD family secretion protein
MFQDAHQGANRNAVPPIPIDASVTDAMSHQEIAPIDSMASFEPVADAAKRRGSHKGRTIVIVVCVIVVLIIGYGISQLFNEPEQTVQTSVVSRGTFQKNVEGKGNLEAYSSAEASAEVSGIVDQVMVGEGDTVHAGDVLYTIKNDSLDDKVTQAYSQLVAAQNSLTEHKNSMNALRNQQTTTTTITPSSTTSSKTTSGTTQSTTSSGSSGVATTGVTSTDIANAQLQIDSAQSTLDAAQSSYDTAVAEAAKRTVTAPMDGAVLTVNVVPGTTLQSLTQANKAPMTIADLSKMCIRIPVSEVDIEQVKIGQEATVTFDALSDVTAKASVAHIANVQSTSGTSTSSASSGSSTSASQSVRYEVTLMIDNPDPRLKSGMTAHSAILVQSLDQSLIVPTVAIHSQSDAPYVVKEMDDGTSLQIPVSITASNDSDSVVQGNIAAGDNLIIGSSSSSHTSSAESR